jgi:lantibiotic modifying enzyme
VSTIVAETYPVIADALKGPAPPFTKTLAPGLGLAEDPGGGESFGTHRCGVLAEGLVEAHARGLTSLTARFDVVRAQFKTRSIRFDRPYLTASSSDDYHLTLPPVARRNPRARNLATPLTAAAEIGARLARQALWHGGACTWVGEDPESVASSRGWGAKTTYSALGPDLYAGSSGVALFLAELSLASGDAVSRRCAVGALRHALDRSIDETDFGLYTGLLGVAWTAVHIGRLLGEAEFIERGGALAAKAETAPNRPDDGEADLFSGKAGAIVALLLLAEDLGNAALNVRAVSLGDMLLRMADVDATGMSWRSPAQRRGRNLTGFAHGAAGVGFALARLFARTRVAAYGEAARRAFAYERRWFDASLGNWRDFRRFDAREGGARDHKSAFAMAWCHGAPGVALSRLEGLAAVGDHLCKDEALTALRTTVEHTKTSLASGGNRGCLCHGLAGNADILLSGARSLQCDFGVGDALAEIAAETVQTASSDENEPPGLMLGMAGQGYALLRRHNPAIPSVLALGAR